MLHHLCKSCPNLPVLCLVDCDAFGLDIFLSYQQGTINSSESYKYAIPRLIFLGVECADVVTFRIERKYTRDADADDVSKIKAQAFNAGGGGMRQA